MSLRDYLQFAKPEEISTISGLVEDCDLDSAEGRRMLIRGCVQAMLKGKLPPALVKEVRAALELEMTMDAHEKDMERTLPAGQSFVQQLKDSKAATPRQIYQNPPNYAKMQQAIDVETEKAKEKAQ